MKSSDAEMFDLFEMTPDLVCITGKDGWFRKINPAVSLKLGYPEEYLMSLPVSTFIHEDDKERTRLRRAELLEGKTLLNFQNRYITQDNEIVWLEWTSIYIPDKEVVFAIAKDITDRKRIEFEIEEKYKKYKSLASHFKKSIESDRKYLAIELHEEVAQLATVMKISLNQLDSELTELSTPQRIILDKTLHTSEVLINSLKRISFSISPNMLDDVGLNEVLRWLGREFTLLNGLPCEFTSNLDENQLTHEMKLDFFRICQEALSNIMYHARASRVWVNMNQGENEFVLTVTDNGKGFTPQLATATGGLERMKERAGSINGRLTIDSEEGRGTVISVMVPIQRIHGHVQVYW